MSSSATTTPASARSDRHRRIVDRYVRGDLLTTIAAQEGVCVKTVRNVARRHGVPRRVPDRTARNAQIIARYADGEPVTDIATDEGVRSQYVSTIARSAGLPPRIGWQRRYPLDESAFDEPTPVGWWLIGLLASDGCVHEPEHRVSLAQRASDSDVLRAFLEYVGSSERPLVDLRLSPAAAARAWPRSLAQEARIFSERICRALAVHGVVPRKTRTLELSRQAATEPAVWLGMFDGDGSGGPRRAHGRPRIDWFGTARVMKQCSEFWAQALSFSTPGAPAVVRHGGGLSKVALYGANAALAAQIMQEASPVSSKRKRLVLEEIANYRPRSRREPAP